MKSDVSEAAALVETLLRLAREYGAARIAFGDVVVEMVPQTAQPRQPTDVASEAHEAIGAAAGRPTDDEMLMWSAPAIGEAPAE